MPKWFLYIKSSNSGDDVPPIVVVFAPVNNLNRFY